MSSQMLPVIIAIVAAAVAIGTAVYAWRVKRKIPRLVTMKNCCCGQDCQRKAPGNSIPVIMPSTIDSNSWLQRDDYATFRSAYGYAANSTRAMEALNKITPEETWFVYQALTRGMDKENAT